MAKKTTDKLYNITQVQKEFLPGISRTELYRLLMTGEISPAYQQGRGQRWLIPESSIEDYKQRLIEYEVRRPWAAGRFAGRAR